ncbi:pseudouridine synthase [Paracoccus sp. TK19116]|uniref:Pseudouridine synthase n=1 Tax=Paracoccus albicereus TaxID=2922394 RepID=A0ABT1MSG0_9RHOB|nr:pseudouridine synthase [Paracoccus albicereus]MCQ0970669.1 pseudouridine synthase [Paracoccus albicereus]
MTDQNDSDQNETDQPAAEKPADADRIAKVIARAGRASRREAERLILEGRVTVNGTKIDSPALDVRPGDRITVDGSPLEEAQPTRLWLYYKPVGLVTSESDEKGRQTVFDALPRDLPRVMSIGRLDLNSEGLLLLTNDGELKRQLELPSTGWMRRYRVRVNGQPSELTFDPLRRGVTIDGEDFQPMEVRLDSQKGANAWLSVGIREGKNREIRRAMAHVGLQVNRLIRVGYGPFKLTGMEENEVREIKRRVLRDQLGSLMTGASEEDAKDEGRPRRAGGGDRSSGPRRDGDRTPNARRDGEGRPGPKRDGDRKPFGRRDDQDRKPFGRSAEGGGKPFERRGDGDRKPYGRRDEGDRKPYGKRDDGDRKPFARREDGDRKPFARREDGDRKPYGKRVDGDRKPFARREDGDRKPYGKREDGDRKPYTWRDDAERAPRSGPKSGGARPDRRTDRGDAVSADTPRKPRWSKGQDASGSERRSADRFPASREGGASKPGPRRDGKPSGAGKPWAKRDDARGPKPTGRPGAGPRPGGSGGPKGRPGPARGPRPGGGKPGGGKPRG